MQNENEQTKAGQLLKQTDLKRDSIPLKFYFL
jgi:hypothetical protein